MASPVAVVGSPDTAARIAFKRRIRLLAGQSLSPDQPQKAPPCEAGGRPEDMIGPCAGSTAEPSSTAEALPQIATDAAIERALQLAQENAAESEREERARLDELTDALNALDALCGGTAIKTESPHRSVYDMIETERSVINKKAKQKQAAKDSKPEKKRRSLEAVKTAALNGIAEAKNAALNDIATNTDSVLQLFNVEAAEAEKATPLERHSDGSEGTAKTRKGKEPTRGPSAAKAGPEDKATEGSPEPRLPAESQPQNFDMMIFRSRRPSVQDEQYTSFFEPEACSRTEPDQRTPELEPEQAASGPEESAELNELREAMNVLDRTIDQVSPVIDLNRDALNQQRYGCLKHYDATAGHSEPPSAPAVLQASCSEQQRHAEQQLLAALSTGDEALIAKAEAEFKAAGRLAQVDGPEPASAANRLKWRRADEAKTHAGEQAGDPVVGESHRRKAVLAELAMCEERVESLRGKMSRLEATGASKEKKEALQAKIDKLQMHTDELEDSMFAT